MILNIISCIIIVLLDYFVLSKLPYILIKEYISTTGKFSFNSFIILVFSIALIICILLEFLIYRKTDKKQKISLTILKFIILAFSIVIDFQLVRKTNNLIYLFYYFGASIGLVIVFISTSIYFLTPKLREHLKPKKDIFYLNSK